MSMLKVVFKAKLPKAGILVFLCFLCGLLPLAASAAGPAAIPTAREVATAAGIPVVSLAIFIINIIRIILGLLAFIAIALIIYGGFVWMTSGGDPNKVQKAKQIIYNVVIGLIIIFSAFAIASFVISILKGISGPEPFPGPIPCIGCNYDIGRSAIGGGPIESVYPRPNQTNVPINTRVAVTFKEDIDPASICDLSGGGTYCNGQAMRNVQICQISATGSACLTDPQFSALAFAGTTVYQASPTDFKTFVFMPSKYLGNEDELNRTFAVTLQNGIIATSTKKSIFTGYRYDSYTWAFKTNGRLDLTPPEIQKFEIYPNPDQAGMEDVYNLGSQATAGAATVTFNSQPNYEVPIMIVDKYYLGQSFNDASRPTLTQVSGAPVAPAFKFYIQANSGFNVSGTVTSTIGFVVGGSDKFVSFYQGLQGGVNYADAAYVLGIVYSTTGDCAGQTRCMPLLGKRTINTGMGLTLSATGDLEPGTAWRFDVGPAKAGDYLTLVISSSTRVNFLFNTPDDSRNVITKTVVGPDGHTLVSTDFQTVTVGADTLGTEQNLARVINNYNQSRLVVSAVATTSPVRVILTAKAAGSNSLSLTKSAGSLFTLSGSLSGQSREINRTVKGVRDPYNNSVFRVTFTEPISPINLDSSIVVTINGVSVTASTSFANQYRTVEFMGNNPCGINTCGQQMYCWLDPNTSGNISSPANILVKANTLKFCASGTETSTGNEWCKTWGGTCNSASDQGRCKLATGLYYPQAIATIDGIIDMSNNSLNGNFNSATTTKGYVTGNAEGPEGSGNGHSNLPGPYNLNDHVDGLKPTYAVDSTKGDGFTWSFFVSSQVDNTAPLLTTINPIGDATYGLGAGESFNDPVKFAFNTLMRMATLKPGWGYADSTSDPDWSLRYLVLKTITANANPVGYWVSSQDINFDNDGLADYTIANLQHNPFDLSVRYGPLAGSGVQSITQNCFLPGNGPQNAGDPNVSMIPTDLVSNSCNYTAGSQTTGCVTDETIASDRRVTSTNPASYGYLNCREIDGTVTCNAATQNCKVHYATSTDSPTGSWVITKDYPAVTNSANGGTGCCFGKCY